MNVFIIVAHPEAKSFNFITQKDTRIFKQQIEEIHATEFGGFAPDIEAELEKLERRVCERSKRNLRATSAAISLV